METERLHELLPGKMVCLYVQKYPNDWPQLAEIIDCHEDELTIMWYHASYTGYCRKFTIKQNKKQRVNWVEQVRKEDVLFHPFNLLPSSKLPKEITDLLKEKEKSLFLKWIRWVLKPQKITSSISAFYHDTSAGAYNAFVMQRFTQIKHT